MPPAVIMQVLTITEEQLKAAQAEQKAPTASLAQFEEAMKASVRVVKGAGSSRVGWTDHCGTPGGRGRRHQQLPGDPQEAHQPHAGCGEGHHGVEAQDDPVPRKGTHGTCPCGRRARPRTSGESRRLGAQSQPHACTRSASRVYFTPVKRHRGINDCGGKRDSSLAHTACCTNSALGSSHILTRARVTVVWTQIGGSLAKIEALFSDMAPEPQKGKPMPPGMINALLRVPKEATTCTPEDFIECFQRTFPLFHVLPAARLIACALRLPHVAMVSA